MAAVAASELENDNNNLVKLRQIAAWCVMPLLIWISVGGGRLVEVDENKENLNKYGIMREKQFTMTSILSKLLGKALQSRWS